MPLLNGRISSSTVGSSDAPSVLSRASMPPRASQPACANVLACPRGASAAPLSQALTRSASSRWNGCGCRDVLRWCPVLAHRRRGPRSGHIYCLHECACGAVTTAPSCWSPSPLVALVHLRTNQHDGSSVIALASSLPPLGPGHNIRPPGAPRMAGFGSSSSAYLGVTAERQGRPPGEARLTA